MARNTNPKDADDPGAENPEPADQEPLNRAARRAKGKKPAPPPPPGKFLPTGRRNPDHGRNWAARRSG